MKLIKAFALTLMASIPLLSAQSQAREAFPKSTVSLVIPFAAGGGADIIARLLAEGLEKEWGKPVIAVNKPGAGGQISMQYMAKAKPDGYTIGVTTSGTLAVNPTVYKEINYDSINAFEHVTILIEVPFVLVVDSKSKYKDLAGWVKHAQDNPDRVSLSNAGIGSHQYLAAHHFADTAKIKLNMIPYSGGPAMTADLLGGHLDAVFDNTMVQLPFITDGRVRALGVSTPERVAYLPSIPTLSEAGVQGYTESAWYGLVTPAGTPKHIVEAIRETATRVLNQPGVTKKLNDMGATVVASSSDAALQRVRDDMARFKKMVDLIGLQPL
ncbi:tripartite tricarboxylate transporter substrate binding protein [Pusillimonas sp. ANT_WB101]|uniref:Bug family tripartite tricarboxylate transporter substrate binding protein n=1 Tax=Pusillimonas sp. ANT_WB101 TaxID=2597356 RepID=UPI0011EC71CC|nr:tripartite tricarboxylate transporter substrate binding protein [Pusillimonas sp. ANT_WB101]KAA0911345.1 tripartite tricarboxylate transporter substrate binding protein [Pusillimonas sp. ANT_WB101]